MSEPTACDRARPYSSSSGYCSRCNLLVGTTGFHVIEHAGMVRVVIGSLAQLMGCRASGVAANSRGRRELILIHISCFGRPVRLSSKILRRSREPSPTRFIACSQSAHRNQHHRSVNTAPRRQPQPSLKLPLTSHAPSARCPTSNEDNEPTGKRSPPIAATSPPNWP